MYKKLIELLEGKYELKKMHDGIIRINYNNVIMDITEGAGKINIYATEYQNGVYVEIVNRKYSDLKSAYIFTVKILEDLTVSDIVEFPTDIQKY